MSDVAVALLINLTGFLLGLGECYWGGKAGNPAWWAIGILTMMFSGCIFIMVGLYYFFLYVL